MSKPYDKRSFIAGAAAAIVGSILGQTIGLVISNHEHQSAPERIFFYTGQTRDCVWVRPWHPINPTISCADHG